jgi:hypothetical protein
MVFLFILVFGSMGYAVYYQLKKTDPMRADSSVRDDIKTAQDFLPFEDIRDGMIILGGHKYRSIIEVSSTNYNLKTDNEKEIIEISFQQFLNSLTFPVTFFIQTKVIDDSKMLEQLINDVKEATAEFSGLAQYGETYINEMANLYSYIGNNKQKKKYLIVPYEEAINLANLNNTEKYEYSMKELQNRASILVDGLNTIGIRAKVLDTKESAELVYSIYHKDNYAQIENIINGDYLSLISEGRSSAISKMGADAKLDLVLVQSIQQLESNITENLPDFQRQNFEKAIHQIKLIRNQMGGYYEHKLRDSGAEDDFFVPADFHRVEDDQTDDEEPKEMEFTFEDSFNVEPRPNSVQIEQRENEDEDTII